MTIGSFSASLKEAEQYLKGIGALKSLGVKELNNFSDEFKKASQQRDYFTAYKIAKRNLDYNLLLKDDSFFQFSFEQNATPLPNIRYAFFQNPQDYIEYNEFVETIVNEDLIESGEIFREEYEQYLSELQINVSSIPVRYDVDLKNYKALVHSVSHIHIGHMNDVRIPCDKIITPRNFVLFVTKHTNYNLWKDLIDNNDTQTDEALKSAKSACKPLDVKFWGNEEARELFLT